MLTGDRVIKYVIVDCPVCNQSMQLDWKKVIESPISEQIMCPWCENMIESYAVLTNQNSLTFKSVKADN